MAVLNKNLATCNRADKLPGEVLGWEKKFLEVNVDDEAYANALATELQGLICGSDANAIYILHGLITSQRLAETGRKAITLVDFITSKDCPVSASLTDDDKLTLLKIKEEKESRFRRH